MKISIDTEKIVDKIKKYKEKKKLQAPKEYTFKGLMDFLTFKSMLFPKFIILVFIISTFVCVSRGLGYINSENGSTLAGILWIFIGPLSVHFFLELLVVLFVQVDVLRSIRDELQWIRKNMNQDK